MDALLREIDDQVLRITGDDARGWLGGQVTNDIRGLTPGSAVYTLILTTRGKILADAWVVDRDGELLLLVPSSVAGAVKQHFEDHIIMEDVILEPTGEAVITVQGPSAAEMVKAAGFEAAFPCDRLGRGGFDLLLSRDATDGARASLRTAGAQEIDEPGWERERVRLARPRFGADFGEQHYPQEAGLKALAVSFEKGCYLGQEVVCMLENRGQLTRRLVQLRGDARPGDPLTLDAATVGSVTSAIDGWALGYVKRACASPGIRVRSGAAELQIIAIVGESTAGQSDRRAL